MLAYEYKTLYLVSLGNRKKVMYLEIQYSLLINLKSLI